VTQRFLILCALLAALVGCASYTVRPITATVIDSSTRQPLEGVHVIALWQVDYANQEFTLYSENAVSTAFLTQMEDVTNSKGVFHFSEWRSDVLPAGVPNGVLHASSPHIFLFKAGYASKVIMNNGGLGYLVNPNYQAPTPQASQWDGKTIELQPIPPVVPQGKWGAYIVGPTIDMLLNCRWKSIAKYLTALIRERERIVKLSPHEYLPVFTVNEIDRSGDPTKCGRARDVLMP
jgi:hypothetical protein